MLSVFAEEQGGKDVTTRQVFSLLLNIGTVFLEGAFVVVEEDRTTKLNR